jgi:type II secretory pathway pseudopilin PulG
MDAYQLQQLQQQLQQQQQLLLQQQQQQQHEQPPLNSEDYDMWAATPDYGGADSNNMATGSGAGSSNPTHDNSRGGSLTRSFIAPGGGQYWEGRRSNSFSNLEGAEAHAAAAGSAGSLERTGIARSRSSSELAREGEQLRQ